MLSIVFSVIQDYMKESIFMQTKWHLLYCDQNFDVCPVADFIDACPPKHQIKILRFLTLLEEH